MENYESDGRKEKACDSNILLFSKNYNDIDMEKMKEKEKKRE